MEKDIIYNEDCLTTLSKMENNSIDLMVTSPPYNKGYWSEKCNLMCNYSFCTNFRASYLC